MKTSAQRQQMTEEQFNNGIESLKLSLSRSIVATEKVIQRSQESIRKIRGVDALRASLNRGL